MKKSVLFIFLLVSSLSFSQKIKLKKGEVLVDNEVWVKYDGCGGWDQMCSIANLNGDELIYMKLLAKPETVDEKYWKVNFLGTQMSLDLNYNEGFGNINSRLLEKFYNAKVINPDGTLNEEKVIRMVEKYGSPFTDKANTSNQTIIINNNQTPEKPGVNIQIGR
ncbi:MAG: hypothetical protein R2802_08440 [Flavobacteriaceae bacterium]|nr:hypothetical protein [Mangrovimonas sp.]MCB0469853.1 hypothetical protein [Flavobacteriaceae bacterium]MCB0431575.1 hypothetical protein [Mangrovimonas sp.]MCB0437900.1 hypothetical protein [Mangrovimonas sp.]HPF97231.1 hypothetical protein [Mangrovimonas sp.]